MGIWQWIHQAQRDALTSNDLRRRKMLALYLEASQVSGAFPHQAVALYTEAREAAVELGDACWILFLYHWQIETLMWVLRDFTTALDLAVAAVVEARKERAAVCPFRDRTYINLVEVYTETDPVGYEEICLESIAELEQSMTLDYESKCMLAFRRALMFNHTGNLDLAEVEARRCITITQAADGARYYEALGHAMICETLRRRGQFGQQMAQHATIGERFTQLSTPVVYLPEFLAWNVLARHALGDSERAAYLYRKLTSFVEHQPGTPSAAYHNAIVTYHRLLGDLETALAIRQEQLNLLQHSGKYGDLVECHLDRCRLLGEMGLDLQPALQATRDAIDHVKKPDPYLAQLTQIESGNYNL